ncbi:ferric siderophore ABC transporter substrate-binding protein [Chryseobacterium sp. MDT2-18]|uniref:ferric siderophore ABC transporter substrate-binding protein n=1 Tax=Chryseobacterium sp. MDT2-18 TaxID=1259136 RepID=UPI00277D2227|nr:ferric siderophore ABC transporter substrate-binding protein [Chryseobacterium sp. MDT2-18]MDQ0475969.1 outer membrane biosynthesis protein TonB [Chryseobacterium sp. MDT2-18]
MDYIIQHKKNEEKDRRRSAVITVLISLLLFLGMFFYKFTKITEKPEQITTMLINFGDNKEGAQVEEPANQEGSLAANTEVTPEVKPEPVKEVAKPIVKEKIITGTNTKISTPKVEKVVKVEAKMPAKNTPAKVTPAKTNPAKATTPNANTGTGDGKGTAAIGNLLKGRGTKTGTQGTSTAPGNSGDPLGGEGNGDSKIGIDRKLVGFIPGTMGRGGAQPSHSCSASGSISIAYTVDKAGNVSSARRSGGISDPCVVSASVSWVKQYVKAEKSNTSSTGVYSITF